jgi:hypothetical protein
MRGVHFLFTRFKTSAFQSSKQPPALAGGCLIRVPVIYIAIHTSKHGIIESNRYKSHKSALIKFVYQYFVISEGRPLVVVTYEPNPDKRDFYYGTAMRDLSVWHLN